METIIIPIAGLITLALVIVIQAIEIANLKSKEKIINAIFYNTMKFFKEEAPEAHKK